MSDKTIRQLVEEHRDSGGGEPLRLHGKVFDELQQLRGVTLPFDVHLEGARFNAGLEINDCTFEKDLNASDVDFGGNRADFADSAFKAFAVFRPRNAAHISLRSSTFANGLEIALPRDRAVSVDLRYVRIAGSAWVKPLDYGQAGYQGTVAVLELEAAELTVTKESSLEVAGLDARKLHLGEIVLQDKASVYVSDVSAAELYFNDVRQVDKANVAFNRVDLTQARFSGSNVERYAFSNVQWPQRDGRTCLLEELEWREGRYFSRPASPTQLADCAERLIENYRQLVLNFEAKRNYELAESFHTSEMEMLRHRAASALPAPMGRLRPYMNAYWLYRILSGYGANYVRAGQVLGGLLIFFSAVFMLTGINYRHGGGFEYDLVRDSAHRPVSVSTWSQDAATAMALTLSIATLQKDRPMDPAGIEGVLVSSALLLAVPAQAALLLFALRRRFRRASI